MGGEREAKTLTRTRHLTVSNAILRLHTCLEWANTIYG